MLNMWQISISTFLDAHWIIEFSVRHKNNKKTSLVQICNGKLHFLCSDSFLQTLLLLENLSWCLSQRPLYDALYYPYCRGLLEEHRQCYNTKNYAVELLRHLTELLVFSQGFKTSTERLKCLLTCFKTNAQLSSLSIRISDNLVCKKHRWNHTLEHNLINRFSLHFNY